MKELNHISRKVNSLSNKIKRRIDKVASEYGVTAGQAKIIGFIYFSSMKGKDIYQKDIEEEFDIRRSSVTSVLNIMEKNDLIKRVSVKEDGRLKKIVLTERAKELYSSIHFEIEQIENIVTKELSTEEIVIFGKMLERLIKKFAD